MLIGELNDFIGISADRREVEEQFAKTCPAIDPDVCGQNGLIQLARIFECRCLPGPGLVRKAKDPTDDRKIGERIKLRIMNVVHGRRAMPARVISAQDRLERGSGLFELPEIHAVITTWAVSRQLKRLILHLSRVSSVRWRIIS